MTKQEIFNKVAKHLLKQNKQARDEVRDNCCLKDVDGNKCALGCLIPAKLYHPDMEYGSMVVDFFLAYSIPGIAKTTANLALLKDLQYVHDDIKVSEWYNQLQKVANEHKLKFPYATKFVGKTAKKKK